MSVSARLPCCLSRGPLKREFLDIYLSKSFGVGNFGNTEAMRVIFFWKCSKFNGDLENAAKKQEKIFCFWDKWIWIVCIELSLLRREYLSSAVNVLTKSLKTLDVTNIDVFQGIYFHSDQWIWQRSCRWDWISVAARLPCCLSRGHLKRDFLDIFVSTCFGVRNFGNT